MSGSAQVVLLVLTIGCLAFIVSEGRRRQIRVTYLLVWTLGTLAVIPVVAVPSILTTVASWLNISYPPSLAFLVAAVVLLVVCVRFSREITRLEERSRVLAEQFALLRADTLRVATASGPGGPPEEDVEDLEEAASNDPEPVEAGAAEAG